MAELNDLFSRARKLSADELEAFLAELPEHQRRQVKENLDSTIVVGGVEDPHATMEGDSGKVVPSESTPLPESIGSYASGVPDSIGPYKIFQMIGQGGMGQVFMAEQREPVKRRVALKVINTDAPTGRILARFDAERQALAMMDHQNIAKVLDAGCTEDGRSFFAMELVKGIPITEFCDQRRLKPNDRLELLVQTCRAIQHAHDKGIIHRDIKPSNVLVAHYDGRAVAKVIDFGLAKAINDQTQLTDKTLFTRYGQVLGTLEYMSPEQAELSALDIDERTDVYSLGILLYELLTGSTPIGRDRLRSNTLAQILTMIRDEEPPRPSKRLSDSSDTLSAISEQRQTNPRQLTQILKGDLDWIAMKAIEKDRTNRYGRAGELADDIERFLRDEAIHARPPTILYKLKKGARKHKRALRIATLAWIGGALATFSIVLLSRSNWSSERSGVQEDEMALIDPVIDPESVVNIAPESAGDITEDPKLFVDQASATTNSETATHDSSSLLKSLMYPDGREGVAHLTLRLNREGHTDLIRTVSMSEDGNTLISAGDDKTIHVWTRTESLTSGWVHERTVQWPVGSGPRGRIYTSALANGTMAFAGHSSYGTLGDIRFAELDDGKPMESSASLNGHNQVILALDWSPDGSELCSLDMEGKVLQWRKDPASNAWRATTLIPEDSESYGRRVGSALKPYRTFGGIAYLGPNLVVAPRYVGATEQGAPRWHLSRQGRDKSKSILDNLDHIHNVRAVRSTSNGQVLASCDGNGAIGIWKFSSAGEIQSFHQLSVPRSLSIALDAMGRRLLVGTEARSRGEVSEGLLQLWKLDGEKPELLSQRTVSDHVMDVALDSVHNQAIVTQGNKIGICGIDDAGAFAGEPLRFLQVGFNVARVVAFTQSDDRYEIAFATTSGDDGEPKWAGAFDLSQSDLLRRPSTSVARGSYNELRWSVRPIRSASGPRWELSAGKQSYGILPLITSRHGAPTAINGISKSLDDGSIASVVFIGTSGNDNIYAFDPNRKGPPRLIRQFRGHTGEIESLSVSEDGKYLASSSNDSTIGIWTLQEMLEMSLSTTSLWGAVFEVVSEELIVASVREDGPLYARGVRNGDRLTFIEWRDFDRVIHHQADATGMQESLDTMSFDSLVRFKFTRHGRMGPDFLSYPAWRPIARLFVDETRQWAYWTEVGYYDASAAGDMRFGWLVNDSDEDPDFFPAVQFRSTLKSPQLMRNLLSAGSISAAKRTTTRAEEP